MRTSVLCILVLVIGSNVFAVDMERICVLEDNTGFVFAESGKPFVPWRGSITIAIHIYPESQKLDEAMETLAGFAAVSKPVMIEEIFPLKCNIEDFAEFIERTKKHAADMRR